MIVKICGITNDADARQALQAGADWIGLNLVAGPRRIDIPLASEILSDLDDPSRCVMLASLQDRETLDQLRQLRDLGTRLLQIYGNATPSGVRDLRNDGFKLILPWHVPSAFGGARPPGLPWHDRLDTFLSDCGKTPPDYVLLDVEAGGRLGGTGRQADWPGIASAQADNSGTRKHCDWPPLILAGGLTPENVAEAIARVRPAGVDVSSGVESAPGRKNCNAVTAFVDAARAAARTQ